ncbi:MAG: hypothetical protein RIR26_2193 [Pseudomonadota bacterium]
MFRNAVSVTVGLGLVACLAASGEALAECKDLVLRMQDSSGKTAGREITMFLNCHEGSYQIPASSTINVFEWKEGRLCHGHRVCGNAKYWNGHFGVGGLWSWGNTVSDFTSDTKLINKFKKLSDGSPGGQGGDAIAVSSNDSQNTCVNVSSQDARPFNISSDIGSVNGPVSADGNAINGISQNALCVDKLSVNAIWNNRNIRINNTNYDGLGSAVADSYGPQVRDQMQDELGRDGRWMCVQGADIGPNGNGGVAMGGQTFASMTDILRGGALQINRPCAPNVTTQVNAPVTAIGGNGGDGYSPVFGLKSGSKSTKGNIDTDSNDKAVMVDFSLDFGQIERYCTPIRQESCF